MRSDFLSDLLGSRLRAEALGWLFTHADERFFVRQLTALLDLDTANLSRELVRLEKMGLLISTTSGKQKYYQANQKSPIFNELKSMFLKIRKERVKVDISVSSRFKISESQLNDFCRRNHIKRLSLFGSVLRKDFRPDSDIDILVEFEPDHIPGFAIIDMENELSRLSGRKVDLRTPADLGRYFRNKVVKEARVEYEYTQL